MEEHFKISRQIISDRKRSIRNKKDIFSFISKLFLIILVVQIVFRTIFGIFIVYNDDMFPKVVPSDLLIYYRLEDSYYVGDLIVLDDQGADYALRMVAGPGDKVDVSPEGRLVINDVSQQESEIFYDTGTYETDQVSFPLVLSEDEIFVLGDMRRGAKDSRYFGPVKKSNIKGKVFSLYRRANF